jgi:hypothetical protein
MTADFDMGRALSHLAHRAAIEEAAEIQSRMAVRRAMVMHGARGLPLRDFMRRLPSRQQVLAGAPELCAQEAKSDIERLDRLYLIIETLESAFAKYHDAEDKVWAAAIAEHFRPRRT